MGLLTAKADDPAWQPVVLFALALAPEPFSSAVVKDLLERNSSKVNPSRKPTNLSKRDRRTLGKVKASDFFLVRCRNSATRLAADLSREIDALAERLFPPVYMHEVEALAQLGSRILIYGEATLSQPRWWAKQDARTALRCLRLVRLVGGPRGVAILRSITELPSYSPTLTGEWMLASCELCDAQLTWPFLSKENVWLDNTRINDLRPLLQLPNIKFVSLCWTQVRDISLLSMLANLETVRLQGMLVTDLTPLSGLKSLEGISLWNTSTVDLMPLAEIQSLRFVNVSITPKKKEAVEEFKKARPDVAVNSSIVRNMVEPPSQQ